LKQQKAERLPSHFISQKESVGDMLLFVVLLVETLHLSGGALGVLIISASKVPCVQIDTMQIVRTPNTVVATLIPFMIGSFLPSDNTYNKQKKSSGVVVLKRK
jgi:hypothetical protein